MKNKYFRFLASAIILIMFSAESKSEVKESFENKSRNVYIAGCWQFISTNISSTSPIEGKYSVNTSALSSLNKPCTLVTPWYHTDEAGVVTFKTKLSNYSSKGSQIVEVTLVQPQNATGSNLLTYTYKSAAVADLSVNIPAGTYYLIFNWYGEGTNYSAYLDEVVFAGEYFSDITSGKGGSCSALPEKETVKDDDKDGVPNDVDAFPASPDVSFVNYYPAGNVFSSIGFEDLWPSKGDYDFNDIVVDFNLAFLTDKDNNISRIDAKVVLRAVGASFRNGFAFQLMGIKPESVIEVSGNHLVHDIMKLNANGTEAGEKWLTVGVFDNCFDILKHPGVGIGINTEPDKPFVTPDTLEVSVVFKQNGVFGGGLPVKYSDLIANSKFFNPFIFVNGVRGKEVHLADNAPTDHVDPAFLGKGDDTSNPALGRYYKTEKNLPWALSLPQSFDYPIERVIISDAYLNFVSWGLSKGAKNQDWFMDKAGNRNTNKIMPHK